MRDSRLRDSIPNRVGKLFRMIARVHGKAVRPFELSAVHANILTVLWVEGAMTMGELQAALALGSSTLTGAIDRMEKAGLVRREKVAGDRRAFRLEPVAWPAKKRDALLEHLRATEERCLAGLSASERRELGRLLDKAIASTEEVDDGEGD